MHVIFGHTVIQQYIIRNCIKFTFICYQNKTNMMFSAVSVNFFSAVRHKNETKLSEYLSNILFL